jgi:hypothetical protein
MRARSVYLLHGPVRIAQLFAPVGAVAAREGNADFLGPFPVF